MENLFLTGAFDNAPTLRAMELAGFDFSLIPIFFGVLIVIILMTGLVMQFAFFKMKKTESDAVVASAKIKAVADARVAAEKEKDIANGALIQALVRNLDKLSPEQLAQVAAISQDMGAQVRQTSSETAAQVLESVQAEKDIELNQVLNDLGVQEEKTGN